MNQDVTNFEIKVDTKPGRSARWRSQRTIRPRWNLLTLLLVVPVVATWFQGLRVRHENMLLRARIETMAPMARSLRINDPDRLAIRRLPEVWLFETKWELALPREKGIVSGGPGYKLCLATRDISPLCDISSRQNIPPASEFVLPPGRHALELRTVKKDGEWKITALLDEQPVIEIKEPGDWCTDDRVELWHGFTEESYQPIEFAGTAELCSSKPFKSKSDVGDGLSSELANGLILWLQPTDEE